MPRNLFSVLVMLLASQVLQAATLIHNVKGYSMHDGERRTFAALEYENGVITATYPDASSAAASTASTKIDGNGVTLLPGLIDAHGHIASMGAVIANVQLTGASSEFEATQRVVEQAQPGDDWVEGFGWNQVLWEPRQFPTKKSLDAIMAGRPVALRRVDGHAMWVNSAALDAAGITAETADPVGGQIIKNAAGEPTGVLIDKAMDLVEAVMPAASVKFEKTQLARGMDHLVSLGITGAHDAGVSETQMRAYDELAAEDALPLRVYAMLGTWDPAIEARLVAGPKVHPGGRYSAISVKISADGALGSRGAALIEDYHDEPGNRGLMLLPDEELQAKMRRSAALGFQVNVHAIGDLANKRVLDEFDTINADARQRSARHRVEHAQILRPRDIGRFQTLDVIASVQPTHATSDKNMAGDRLGEARLEGAYAWQSLIESGARLAGGSDFPVEPANPFFGLHAAVTRQDREGNPLGGWRPKEALNRDQALSLFTEDAAYSGHQEDSVGRLEPGYQADYILVRDDYFEVDASAIWQNKVLMTVVGGRIEYDQRIGEGS